MPKQRRNQLLNTQRLDTLFLDILLHQRPPPASNSPVPLPPMPSPRVSQVSTTYPEPGGHNTCQGSMSTSLTLSKASCNTDPHLSCLTSHPPLLPMLHSWVRQMTITYRGSMLTADGVACSRHQDRVAGEQLKTGTRMGKENEGKLALFCTISLC